MEQLDFFDVPSPCIGVCSSDDRGYCKGCMRTRQERFDWLTFSNQEKIHIIKLCRRRYQRKRQQLINKKAPDEKNISEPFVADAIQPKLF